MVNGIEEVTGIGIGIEIATGIVAGIGITIGTRIGIEIEIPVNTIGTTKVVDIGKRKRNPSIGMMILMKIMKKTTMLSSLVIKKIRQNVKKFVKTHLD